MAKLVNNPCYWIHRLDLIWAYIKRSYTFIIMGHTIFVQIILLVFDDVNFCRSVELICVILISAPANKRMQLAPQRHVPKKGNINFLLHCGLNLLRMCHITRSSFGPFIWLTLNPLGILARNHPISSKIHQHSVKRYPNCWTWLELIQWQM